MKLSKVFLFLVSVFGFMSAKASDFISAVIPKSKLVQLRDFEINELNDLESRGDLFTIDEGQKFQIQLRKNKVTDSLYDAMVNRGFIVLKVSSDDQKTSGGCGSAD